MYKRFIRGGAGLNDEQKAELRKLNSEISLLELTFSQNLMHETNNTFVTVDKLEELEGLPEANIEAAAKMAEENGQKGKWMFNMQRPSCNPVLQYCKTVNCVIAYMMHITIEEIRTTSMTIKKYPANWLLYAYKKLS